MLSMDMMDGMVYAPFTPHQVANLLERQASPRLHPYTCPYDPAHGQGALRVTPDGLRCDECGYVQVAVCAVDAAGLFRPADLPAGDGA